MEVFAGVGENADVCRDPDCRSPLTPKLISIYHGQDRIAAWGFACPADFEKRAPRSSTAAVCNLPQLEPPLSAD